MDFNQESIHNADSWLGYRGLRSIEPNKAASIRASPRVVAASIIGQHEPPLDNEPADAPLLRSLFEKDLLFTRCLLPSTSSFLHLPTLLDSSLPVNSYEILRNTFAG